MSGERIKRYWCDDCNCFVKKDHRCQQWDTVYIMPEGAFKDLESQLSKATEERDRAVKLLKMVAKNHKPLDELCDMAGVHRYTGMFSGIDEFLSSLTENKS